MTKPTAIRLTSKNVNIIEAVLNIPRKEIENEYLDRVLRSVTPESIYYVKDAYLFDVQVPYLTYSHRMFLEEFASVPPGIEEHFVPVTQVRG
jgi:hypothetical protein